MRTEQLISPFGYPKSPIHQKISLLKWGRWRGSSIWYVTLFNHHHHHQSFIRRCRSWCHSWRSSPSQWITPRRGRSSVGKWPEPEVMLFNYLPLEGWRRLRCDRSCKTRTWVMFQNSMRINLAHIKDYLLHAPHGCRTPWNVRIGFGMIDDNGISTFCRMVVDVTYVTGGTRRRTNKWLTATLHHLVHAVIDWIVMMHAGKAVTSCRAFDSSAER